MTYTTHSTAKRGIDGRLLKAIKPRVAAAEPELVFTVEMMAVDATRVCDAVLRVRALQVFFFIEYKKKRSFIEYMKRSCIEYMIAQHTATDGPTHCNRQVQQLAVLGRTTGYVVSHI